MKKIFRFLFLVFCLFTSTNPLHAQWIKTSLPDNGNGSNQVYCFAVSGANLFAGTAGGVFRSTDNGTTWTSSTGIPVYAFSVSGTNVFAGTSTMTYGGIIRSTDNGTTWTGMGLGYFSVGALANINGYFFAGTCGGGIFLSTTNGASWTQVDTTGLMNYCVGALAVSPNGTGGTSIFAGINGNGVFLTTNFGENWTPVSSGLTDLHILSLCVSGTSLFAGSDGSGMFRSTNSGMKWTAINTGLTNYFVWAFAVSGTNLFAGGGGVFLSTNNGTNWNAVSTGLTDMYSMNVNALAVYGTNLFAGTMEGVWRRPLSEMITGVKETNGDLPAKFSVSQNYPNPFNPTTVINYQLAASSFVTLKVYDVLGREVATLVNGRQSTGYHNANFEGRKFSSGVYLFRLEAIRSDGGSFIDTKRMVLLK